MLHTRVMGYGRATSVYAYRYISIMLLRSNQHCVSKHYQLSKETSEYFIFASHGQLKKRKVRAVLPHTKLLLPCPITLSPQKLTSATLRTENTKINRK